MPIRHPRRAGLLLATGQQTVYVAGDDGDYRRGLIKRYSVLSTGAQSGTTNVDTPSYAGNGIAFAATTPGTITDTGNGLATFKTGDVIVVRGSASNDGVYNVSTGNVAGTIRTTEATLLEAATPYVSICKRVAPSNNTVIDLNTGLMWLRYTTGGPALLVGLASDGKLCWNDATYHFTLHAAGADLQIIASSKTLRIVGGAGEVARYHVGDVIVCSGFANAVNNRTGYVIQSVTVNGADLDIVLGVFNATLINEAAAGARTIALVCQSIFAFCAAANAASLGGYTDWRVPNIDTMASIADGEPTDGGPNSTAFPSWDATNNKYWSSSVIPNDASASSMWVRYSDNNHGYVAKATTAFVALVRGGV